MVAWDLESKSMNGPASWPSTNFVSGSVNLDRMPLSGVSTSTIYRAVIGTNLETTALVLPAARATAGSLWVFTHNQTVARVPGSKVTEQPPQRNRPQQPVAALPTSLLSYSLRLRLLLPVAARSPLHPLRLRWPLISQAKPLHPLPFAL